MEWLKVGDTAYVIVECGCQEGECSELGGAECAYSEANTTVKDIYACRRRHARVREMKLFKVEYIFERKGACIRLNGGLEINADEVYFTPEAALKALKGEAANV